MNMEHVSREACSFLIKGAGYMFVQIRKWIVTEGNSQKIIERFSKKPDQGPSLLEQREGFISRELLVKNVRRGEEEVIMIIRWDSEEAWKAWEKALSILLVIKLKLKSMVESHQNQSSSFQWNMEIIQ